MGSLEFYKFWAAFQRVKIAGEVKHPSRHHKTIKTLFQSICELPQRLIKPQIIDHVKYIKYRILAYNLYVSQFKTQRLSI